MGLIHYSQKDFHISTINSPQSLHTQKHKKLWQTLKNFEYPKKTQKKEKGCCAAVHSTCDQHPFSGILVQWFVPPVLNFFDSLQDDRSYFPPAFLVCRWYPELFSSLIWDVLVLLYIDSAAVHLRKSTDICR